MTAPAAAPVPTAVAPLASRAIAIPNAPVAATGDRRVLVPAEAPAPAPSAVQLAAAPVAPVAVRPARMQETSASYAPAANASSALALPRDEQPPKRRSAEVVNDLQLGPQSLVLDNFFARGDIVPGALQLDFGYRFAIDDAAAPHQLFLAGLESGRCLYLSYLGPLWSNAHIFAGSVSQRFGRFRIGAGIVAEQESDAQGNGYPTVFGTGSVGAAF